jgi:hypothetical protein
MNQELEKYIDMALVDGVITESERTFLQKKAAQLGVDDDEFDFVLSAKIQMKEKELQTSSPPPPPTIQRAPKNSKSNSQKEGDIKKCPACGAHVQSFSTNCVECGHEFRNVEANICADTIFEKFKIIDEEVKNKYYENKQDRIIIPKSWLNKESVMMKQQAIIDMEIGNACNERKVSFISAFPIPNTREDILEILALGVPLAKKKLSFSEKANPVNLKMKKAWLAKCEQIIIKARIAMIDDKKSLELIEVYAKELNL